MKPKPAFEPNDEADELPSEIDLDYAKAKPNRFAAQLKAPTIAVVLDPDVAEVFTTSDSVNQLLRSVLSALPADVKR